MKYLNFKRIVGMLIATVLIVSCDKNDDPAPLGDKGQTVIKMLGGGDPEVKLWSVDFVNKPTTLLAVDIRRDIPGEGELNKEITVVIKDDTAAVRALDPALINFPEAFYTYDADGVTKVGGAGGTFTFVFKPGEIAKTIYLTIPDATMLSTSNTYGLGFTITSVTGSDIKIGTARSIVYKIGAKNAYDGIYKVTGEFLLHPLYAGTFGTSAADGGLLEVALVTTGANTVKRLGITPDDEIGGYDGFIFFVNAANGGPGYGGFSNVFPAYSVNTATNAVTVYALPGSANSVAWDNLGSTYNPSTKTFDLHYGYNGSTANPRKMNEKWVYVRAR